EAADDLQAAFAPRARDDRGLDEVALDAVERGRLVVLVEQSRGDEEQARAQRPLASQLALDERLFDLDLAGIAGRRDRVLDLELGDELGLLVEAMLQAEDKAGEVGDRLRAVVGRAVVVDLAVAREDRRWPERDSA